MPTCNTKRPRQLKMSRMFAAVEAFDQLRHSCAKFQNRHVCLSIMDCDWLLPRVSDVTYVVGSVGLRAISLLLITSLLLTTILYYKSSAYC